MNKYKVTAYKLTSVFEYRKDNSMRISHRWVKVASWNEPTKALALKIVNMWSHRLQPFFKATIQSIKRR